MRWMHRRAGRGVAVVSAFLLILAGCGNGEDTEAGPAADQDQGATEETEETLNGENGRAPDTEAPPDGGQAELVSGNISLGLLLASAEIRSVNLDDTEDEFVDFCFEDRIQTVKNRTGFAMWGVDPANVVNATQAVLNEDQTECLVVGFPAGTDLRAYPLAVARDAAVENVEGEVNIEDAVPLSGAGDEVAGATAAPELVSFNANDTLNRIDYFFGENLQENGQANGSAFGYYTLDGTRHAGQRVVTVEERRVTVEFDEQDGAQIDEAVRIFAEQGAVQDRQGTESPVGALGGATAAPDLTNVARVADSDTQWDFSFDEGVKNPQARSFFLYSRDGQRFPADFATTVDGDTIRATARAVEDFADEIALAGITEGAVESNDAQGGENTIGARIVGAGAAVGGTGLTAGPDLVGSAVDEDAGQATFLFDAMLEDNLRPELNRFRAVTESGIVAPGERIIEVSENRVVVFFGEDTMRAARAFNVMAGAVEDEQGNRNPPGTVRR